MHTTRHCFCEIRILSERVLYVSPSLHRVRDCTFSLSGESGAGKTETTKIIVGQIMHLCRAGKTDLEEKIKNLNPFLEAFGNSKTGVLTTTHDFLLHDAACPLEPSPHTLISAVLPVSTRPVPTKQS
jgi:hypothetical protein